MDEYSVQKLITKANKIGANTGSYVKALLHPHAMQNLRKTMGILELAGKHPAEALEDAASQALAGRKFTWAFSRLLEAGQAEQPISINQQTRDWVRGSDYFIHNQET